MPKYVVRHGSMRLLTVAASRNEVARGMNVIVRSSRGLEAGEVLCESSEATIKQLKNPGSGQVIREMTTDDENELSHIKQREAEEFETCMRYVDQLDLDMLPPGKPTG